MKVGRNEFRVNFTSTTPIIGASGTTLSMVDLLKGKRIRVEGTLTENTNTKTHLVTAAKITVVDTGKIMKRVKRAPMGK